MVIAVSPWALVLVCCSDGSTKAPLEADTVHSSQKSTAGLPPESSTRAVIRATDAPSCGRRSVCDCTLME
jgi:hypothetical protein